MAGNVHIWSLTAADNDDADASINWLEGQTPGTVNASARGMMAAFASFLKDNNGSLTTAGSANAYTIAAPNINYPSLSTGLTISAKASFTNTAGASLNVNSLGAKNIRVQTTGGEAALAAGQMQIAGHYNFQYDTALDSAAGAWLLLNPTTDLTKQIRTGFVQAYAGAIVPSGWLFADGLTIGNAASGATARANADTVDLFTLLWISFANAQLAVSAGRGATAAADYAANKTIALPDLRGRAIFGLDAMSGAAAGRITFVESLIDGVTIGTSGGAQGIALAVGHLPVHTHTGTTAVDAGHTHTGTTGNESVTHTHAGTTDTASATHTHSGTTAAESATHVHTGTTGNESASHTHGLSGGTTDSTSHTHTGTSDAGGIHDHGGVTGATDLAHTHTYTQPVFTTNAFSSGSSSADSSTTSASTGGASINLNHTHVIPDSSSHTHTFTTDSTAHTHTFSFTTGAPSASHTHSFTSATESATHTHTITTTTESQSHSHNFVSLSASITHTHSFTTSSGGSHSHTFTTDATGGGSTHNNMSPAYMLVYLIKL